MLGAIAGDIVGSVYENFRTKRKDFALFTPLSTYTDDSVLTVAVADAILKRQPYGAMIKAYARRHPLRGYGPKFLLWMASSRMTPYNSFGNGSAMRVSPVGWAYHSVEEVLLEAQRTAECTHNHSEGIKGAQATALAVFWARTGADKETIRREIEQRFGYDLHRTIDGIRPSYGFDITCQGSVPEAIVAFLDSTSFEDALRNAVSLGGDADTQAAIAGSIAEAYYKDIPENILSEVTRRLSRDLWEVTDPFVRQFGTKEIRERVAGLSDNQ